MPALAIAATSADTQIPLVPGYARVSIHNPVASAVRVTYHQGSASPANAAVVPDTGAPSIAAGETIILNVSNRGVYLNTPANVGGSVNWTALE